MNEPPQSHNVAPLFNPWSPEFIADPYPVYHRLREADRMYLTSFGFPVATRYADVAHILRDKRFGKDFAGRMTRRSGPEIIKGQSVVCLLGAANRDPDMYSDPDRLDIARADIRSLSFGGGIHHCLGAQLARIEAEIAIGTLLRRLPNLRLHDIEHPDWRQTFVLRGLSALPASW